MTYGELRAKGTSGWTTNHVIDDFCTNARFCNKNGWKNDTVSEYEMGIINHWMAKESAVFLDREAA